MIIHCMSMDNTDEQLLQEKYKIIGLVNTGIYIHATNYANFIIYMFQKWPDTLPQMLPLGISFSCDTPQFSYSLE